MAADPDPVQNQFIFGYGSLISCTSAARTGVVCAAPIPCTVAGLARSWHARVTTTSPITSSVHAATAVTITQGCDVSDKCSGVLLAVTGEELAKFDVREGGYKRVSVPPAAVTVRTDAVLPDTAAIWCYVSNHMVPADECAPIYQTYVDVILSGACDGFGREFALDFIRTTRDWSVLVDDRPEPRYTRADLDFLQDTARVQMVDALLSEAAPELLARRLSLTTH
jgi:cation transport regulator ChaC